MDRLALSRPGMRSQSDRSWGVEKGRSQRRVQVVDFDLKSCRQERNEGSASGRRQFSAPLPHNAGGQPRAFAAVTVPGELLSGTCAHRRLRR